MFDPTALADELRAAGLTPTPFVADDLARFPLADEDRALLVGCGLPARAQPGYLYFAQPSGAPRALCSLADEYPRRRNDPTARARVLLAKDGSGNLLWIQPARSREVLFFDHDEGRAAVANSTLGHLLRALAAYRRFLVAHGEPDAAFPSANATTDDLRALRGALRALDPACLAGPAGLWHAVFAYRGIDD